MNISHPLPLSVGEIKDKKKTVSAKETKVTTYSRISFVLLLKICLGRSCNWLYCRYLEMGMRLATWMKEMQSRALMGIQGQYTIPSEYQSKSLVLYDSMCALELNSARHFLMALNVFSSVNKIIVWISNQKL